MDSAMSAKKSVLMKLISMMDDETSEKLKPEGAAIEVMKIEGKPMKHKMEMPEEDEDEYDTEDEDIKSFMNAPEMDGEKDDMSVLDRFKKKYSKED